MKCHLNFQLLQLTKFWLLQPCHPKKILHWYPQIQTQWTNLELWLDNLIPLLLYVTTMLPRLVHHCIHSKIWNWNGKKISTKLLYSTTVPNESYHFWAVLLHKWLLRGVADIHEYSFKMPYLPIILFNFSWAKSHNFFIMEKSKLNLLINIC